MNAQTLKTAANWKTQFQIMWNDTPKKFRKTIAQIDNIKSRAKLYAAIYM
jgi:hypothetical protein